MRESFEEEDEETDVTGQIRNRGASQNCCGDDHKGNGFAGTRYATDSRAPAQALTDSGHRRAGSLPSQPRVRFGALRAGQ